MRLINLNKILLTVSMLFLISSGAFANNSPQSPAHTASQTAPNTTSNQASDPASNPASVIHTTLKKITTFSSNSDKVNPVKLRVFIESQIIPHFDFDNMSHWITGRYARNMTDQDKSDFQRSLRETFLSSLSKHLGSFDADNTRIKFYRPRYRSPEEAFVSTSIYRPGTMPVRLDFRMRRANNGWKIIDIKANGSSAVLYYRRHFISQLRQYQRHDRYRGYTNRPTRRSVDKHAHKHNHQQTHKHMKQPVQTAPTHVDASKVDSTLVNPAPARSAQVVPENTAPKQLAPEQAVPSQTAPAQEATTETIPAPQTISSSADTSTGQSASQPTTKPSTQSLDTQPDVEPASQPKVQQPELKPFEKSQP